GDAGHVPRYGECVAVRPSRRRDGQSCPPRPLGRGLGEGQCRRARRRGVQSRAKTVGLQRLRLACRGRARVIPIPHSSWPGTRRALAPRSPAFRSFRSPVRRAGNRWIPTDDDNRLRGPRSMAEKTPYYLTTAIAYPNGPPHIGHAYEAIATDA